MKGRIKWLTLGAAIAVTVAETLVSSGVLSPVGGSLARAVLAALLPPTP